MLPRAALRAIRPSSIPSSALRYASPIMPATALRIRHASNSNRPPRPPPPKAAPNTSRKTQTPPPPRPQQPATGQARQTSPGTQFPKDQTWKPKDGIKMGGPAAATASGAGAAAAASPQSSSPADKAAYTPVNGKRPEEPEVIVRREGTLEEDVKPQEPLAQKYDMDEPREGGQRDAAQQAQAAAENTPPPPEQPAEVEADAAPKGPLPDLRQGIPSTFDMEFGEGKQQQGKQQEGLDITEEEPSTQERRQREEREYDRSAYETSLDRKRAQMANYLYAFIAIASAAAGVYFSRPFGSKEEIPSNLSEQDASSWSPTSMYARLRARMGSQVGYYTEPTFPKLLPEMPDNMKLPYTLVLSLEDLMIHTTWDREHGYRTAKRPGIDYFIRYLQQYYELVLFTTVPMVMADPVMRKLDPYHIIYFQLGREGTKYDGGDYVKDLAYLNRPLNKTLIVDTNPKHVKNQPENSIILPKWNGDPKDPHTKDLVALIPFLEYVATTGTGDVREVLKSFEGKSIPEEFARREAIARKKFNEQLEAERSKAPKRSLGSLGSALGIKSTPGMSGGMVLADGQIVAEGLKEGKMLSDQIREQGQKQYEFLEKQIREHGAEWLAEEKEAERKAMEGQMKEMKKGAFSWFGGGGGGGGAAGETK